MSKQTIKNFSISDAVQRVSKKLHISHDQAQSVISCFLRETSSALAEHGAVHYTNYFSVILRKRAPRKGKLKLKDGSIREWSTPARTEPEFEASSDLKKEIEEKQGLPCT